MITREQLKVGEVVYISIFDQSVKVEAITEKSVIFSSIESGLEYIRTIERFMEEAELIINKNDIVELYECIYGNSLSAVLLTKSGEWIKLYADNALAQPVDYPDLVIFLSDKPKYKINLKTREVIEVKNDNR